jgi:hypothetical protein
VSRSRSLIIIASEIEDILFWNCSVNLWTLWDCVFWTNNRKSTAFIPNFFIVPPVFIILHCIRCNYFQLPFKFSHWFLLPRKLIEGKFVHFVGHVNLYDWQIIFMKVLVISLIYDSIFVTKLMMRFDSSSVKVCNFVLTPSIHFLREAYY